MKHAITSMPIAEDANVTQNWVRSNLDNLLYLYAPDVVLNSRTYVINTANISVIKKTTNKLVVTKYMYTEFLRIRILLIVLEALAAPEAAFTSNIADTAVLITNVDSTITMLLLLTTILPANSDRLRALHV
jgi:hypothetical protein